MADNKERYENGLGCKEKCDNEWARCMEDEDGAFICITRRRNCYNECRW